MGKFTPRSDLWHAGEQAFSFVKPAGDALIQTLTSELFFSAQGNRVQSPLSGQGQLRGTCVGFEFQVLT